MNLESEWGSVEEFSENLVQALTEQMGAIRETELDRPGMFQKAKLEFENPNNNCVQDVFTDRLDRIVLPADEVYNRLLGVSFILTNGGESKLDTRKVVRMEPRYEGDRRAALVVYLEHKEEDDV